MTTDIKAVAQRIAVFADSHGNTVSEENDSEGRYVLFADHERVVGELRADIEMYAQCESDEVTEVARRGLEITRLHNALAESCAEVERLTKVVESYRQQKVRLDAAMEKSNEHQDQ